MSMFQTLGLVSEAVPAAPADRPEPFILPKQAARLFGVSPRTVTRWAVLGRLPCVTTLGGHRRYREADVRRLLQERGAGPDSA